MRKNGVNEEVTFIVVFWVLVDRNFFEFIIVIYFRFYYVRKMKVFFIYVEFFVLGYLVLNEVL